MTSQFQHEGAHHSEHDFFLLFLNLHHYDEGTLLKWELPLQILHRAEASIRQLVHLAQ